MEEGTGDREHFKTVLITALAVGKVRLWPFL